MGETISSKIKIIEKGRSNNPEIAGLIRGLYDGTSGRINYVSHDNEYIYFTVSKGHILKSNVKKYRFKINTKSLEITLWETQV